MPLLLWHVSIPAKGKFEAAVPSGYELAAYVISGEATFAESDRAGAGQLALFENADGDIAFSNSGETPLDVMVLGGAPAEGPLVFHGPFVMNSVDQVRNAERAYHLGQMGELASA
ncbi:MAG: pirin-like C-terminal cupin domain-containing protein [Betaproteobacteria bacterium]